MLLIIFLLIHLFLCYVYLIIEHFTDFIELLLKLTEPRDDGFVDDPLLGGHSGGGGVQ